MARVSTCKRDIIVGTSEERGLDIQYNLCSQYAGKRLRSEDMGLFNASQDGPGGLKIALKFEPDDCSGKSGGGQ